jgi:hypothetical protein
MSKTTGRKAVLSPSKPRSYDCTNVKI